MILQQVGLMEEHGVFTKAMTSDLLCNTSSENIKTYVDDTDEY